MLIPGQPDSADETGPSVGKKLPPEVAPRAVASGTNNYEGFSDGPPDQRLAVTACWSGGDSNRRSCSGRCAKKVGLISGGTRGRGAAEARLFVGEGAKVVVGDVLDDQARRLAEEINAAAGSRVIAAVHLM